MDKSYSRTSAFPPPDCVRVPWRAIGYHPQRRVSRGDNHLFGDSLTEGVGAEPEEDYPTILSRLLGMRVLNAGHRGDTTARALERVHASVVNKNPRLVILLLDGNDFLRQVPMRETRQNLKEIVRQIQDHGAMVSIAGIKLGFSTDEYGPIFEETAAEFGAIYIPQVMKGIFKRRDGRV